MKLYIGGAWQGQEALARRDNPGAEVLCDLPRRMDEALARGETPEGFARALLRDHPSAVVVADEVGCGLVPVDPDARRWREAMGRACCVLAEGSEAVIRVVCGLGVRIK